MTEGNWSPVPLQPAASLTAWAALELQTSSTASTGVVISMPRPTMLARVRAINLVDFNVMDLLYDCGFVDECAVISITNNA